MARRRLRGGGRKADLRWTLGSNNFTVAAGSSAATIVTSSTVSQTIMRTRGEVLVYADGVQAPGVSCRIACGLIIAQGGQSGTVLSAPLDDGDAPWFYYDVFHLGYEEMVTDGIDIPGITSHRSVIDSKAMRIIRPDQEIQFVVQNTTVLGALTVNVNVAARFLIAD